MRPEQYDYLRQDLADPDCTGWVCPECGRAEYKGAVNGHTGEFIPFSLICDNCGFDANPYAPQATP